MSYKDMKSFTHAMSFYQGGLSPEFAAKAPLMQPQIGGSIFNSQSAIRAVKDAMICLADLRDIAARAGAEGITTGEKDSLVEGVRMLDSYVAGLIHTHAGAFEARQSLGTYLSGPVAVLTLNIDGLNTYLKHLDPKYEPATQLRDAAENMKSVGVIRATAKAMGTKVRDLIKYQSDELQNGKPRVTEQ